MPFFSKAYDEAKEMLKLTERVSNLADLLEKLEGQMEKRDERMAAVLEKLEDKIDKRLDQIAQSASGLAERVTKLEVKLETARESLRAQVLSDVGREIAQAQTAIDLLQKFPELRGALGDGESKLLEE